MAATRLLIGIENSFALGHYRNNVANRRGAAEGKCPRAEMPFVVDSERLVRFRFGTSPSGGPKLNPSYDGDTISTEGKTVRLVGFDTPEAGMNAKCEAERALAPKATFRLRQIIASGGLSLSLVPCARRPGTEGTPACNYGRACGVLTAAGQRRRRGPRPSKGPRRAFPSEVTSPS
jgi:endonuclease YncB( thermonuclease family)